VRAAAVKNVTATKCSQKERGERKVEDGAKGVEEDWLARSFHDQSEKQERAPSSLWPTERAQPVSFQPDCSASHGLPHERSQRSRNQEIAGNLWTMSPIPQSFSGMGPCPMRRDETAPRASSPFQLWIHLYLTLVHKGELDERQGGS
jgi:hypothetical protein